MRESFDADDFRDGEKIVGIDIGEEMQNAFLEYSYSVIYSRALPDARDGLKPVQRRILYGANELGLRPDRGHVKCQRVVGEVMGKYHPHGDQAIYDALVRMAQPFTLRLPLVDGHGNFGSLDDGPAAARYTEARMANAALLMVAGLDEDTVDFVPNYDDTQLQPGVMPAAYPNLLVNGAAGIAVGMATNMPPHNLVEVIGAARHLIANPTCSLEDLMKFVPGPDLPCGGKIVGLEGIRDAYLTGRGSFRTRATARIESITPRRKGIVVTELPYLVGPEKVIDKVKDLVQGKKLQGIADLKDLSDRQHGLRLVIEIKNGFNPDAVLEQLYKLTPMEENFGINNVALVEGQPRTMGLKDLLKVYVDFRTDVVRRRTAHRLAKREERLHLVEGLLIAIVDIDEVIQVIRSSDDAATARARLMDVFDLSEAQATYILDLQLRRLTKFSRIELENEKTELERAIEELRALLENEKLLLKLVSTELADVAKAHGTPRRTVLLESSGASATATAASPLEIADDPCWVLLSSTGLLARTGTAEPVTAEGSRSKHDVVIGAVRTTARGEFGLVTSAGRMVRLSALDLPTLPPTNGAPTLSGGAPLAAYVDLGKGEEPVTIVPIGADAPVFALGTASGVVKRVASDAPTSNDWDVISLKDGDRVVGAAVADREDLDLVFITTDAQLLRFAAKSVRPQGRSAGGMAGIKLAAGARVAFFGVVDPTRDGVVVTSSGSSRAVPGTEVGSLKVTPYAEYPANGRATGGVRCHRFLRGEDTVVLAFAGNTPARAAAANGVAIELPTANGRRDGSGVATTAVIAHVASPPSQADSAARGVVERAVGVLGTSSLREPPTDRLTIREPAERLQRASERDEAYENWLEGLTIEEVQRRFHAQGVTRVLVKRLAPRQDNSKNQIVLPGDISKLALPMGAFERTTTSSAKPAKSEDKYTATMNLHWLTPAGSNPAPATKVIFYPQYPETRLSGFLSDAVDAPRRLLDRDHVTSHGIEGRSLVLGAGPHDVVFALVVPSTAPAARGLQNMAPPTRLVEWAFTPHEVQVTASELLGELHGIHLLPPVKGITVKAGVVVPNGALNAGGTTLETLFGIPPNSKAAPDFRGWELKSYSKSRITLMTPGPTGGRLRSTSIDEFFDNFGYWNEAKARYDFTGAHTATRAPRGHASTEMVVTSDAVRLVDRRTGEVALEWSTAKLLDKWREKHSLAAYVLRRGNAATGFMYGPTVHLGEGASFAHFQAALEDGTIVFDPAIWFSPGTNESKVRCQIRVKLADLSKLYAAHSVHDVRVYPHSRTLAEADILAAGLTLP